MVVFGDEVLLAELLTVADQRDGGGGEERDRERLGLPPVPGLVGSHRADVVARTCLPGRVGVIVVGQVEGWHLF